MARGPRILPSKTDITVIQLAEKFRKAKVSTRAQQEARKEGGKEKEGKEKGGKGGKERKEREKEGKEAKGNREGKEGNEEEDTEMKGAPHGPQKSTGNSKGNSAGKITPTPKAPNKGSANPRATASTTNKNPNEGGQQSINTLFPQLPKGGNPLPINPLGASAAHPITIIGSSPKSPPSAGGKRAGGALGGNDSHGMAIDEGQGMTPNAPNASPPKKPKK